MSSYRLLKHKDFDNSTRGLSSTIQQKALWAQVMLGTRGRTPSVKGTSGINARWRRTPVQGSHYYMWWIPQSESGLFQSSPSTPSAPSILIHSIRHHDKTNTPIDPGILSDYEEVIVSDLDPRFGEQRDINRQLDAQDLALATVKGLPGSGKTVSLLYLVRDILKRTQDGHILYVTYTPRLKRAAQEFLYAQDERVSERVRFCTLTELENEFTNSSLYPHPFGALKRFEQYVQSSNQSSLGPWRKYIQTLYTEIRAYLLGRDFPDAYALPSPSDEIRIPRNALNADVYAQLRGVDHAAATAAVQMTTRAANQHLFGEQKAARAALLNLMMGQQPDWMENLGALLIDEVQDFTLLQIAFLGELARTRAEQMAQSHRYHAPFIFTVAGDESQIVQPSGFDWGVTKNLLYAQLGVRPQEFEFRHQRRAPRKLTGVIDNSWGFYSNLPKSERPSAQRQSFLDEAMEDAQRYEEGGTIYLCPPTTQRSANRSSAPDWTALIQELNEKPGRVLVDMSELLRARLDPSVREQSDEVIFLPRDIKGLERATVIIYGLNDAYESALRLCDEASNSGDVIPRFEARRLFDEMRVALSRSTHTLILLESPQAPVLQALGILPPEEDQRTAGVSTNGFNRAHPSANGATATNGHAHTPGTSPNVEESNGVLDWDELLYTLYTEEMSELEVIEGYLEEVDDLLERERWEQAYRRNRRAYALAQELGDGALEREAEQQFVEAHLQEAESLAHRGKWQQAYAKNREAHELVQIFPDPLLQERVDEQVLLFQDAIVERTQQLLQQAQQWIHSHSYTLAHNDLKDARALVHLLDEAKLQASVDDALADLCWQWAYNLTGNGSTEADAARAAELLEEAADTLDQGGNTEAALALGVLAARYRQIPNVGSLSKRQIPQVLEHAQQYLDIMAPLNAEQEAFIFIERWLEETYAVLGDMVSFYYPWAMAAQSLGAAAIYANFDEHLWELEYRAELISGKTNSGKTNKERNALDRFRAFVLSYNEKHAEAAAAWEALEEWALAAEQARHAGHVEHAYELLRRIKGHTIPEELATAVQVVRRLQQLEHKHEALLPAEKQSIITELMRLQHLLAPSTDISPADDPQ